MNSESPAEYLTHQLFDSESEVEPGPGQERGDLEERVGAAEDENMDEGMNFNLEVFEGFNLQGHNELNVGNESQEGQEGCNLHGNEDISVVDLSKPGQDAVLAVQEGSSLESGQDCNCRVNLQGKHVITVGDLSVGGHEHTSVQVVESLIVGCQSDSTPKGVEASSLHELDDLVGGFGPLEGVFFQAEHDLKSGGEEYFTGVGQVEMNFQGQVHSKTEGLDDFDVEGGEDVSEQGHHDASIDGVGDMVVLGEHHSSVQGVEDVSGLGQHHLYVEGGEGVSGLGQHPLIAEGGEDVNGLGPHHFSVEGGEDVSGVGQQHLNVEGGEDVSGQGHHHLSIGCEDQVNVQVEGEINAGSIPDINVVGHEECESVGQDGMYSLHISQSDNEPGDELLSYFANEHCTSSDFMNQDDDALQSEDDCEGDEDNVADGEEGDESDHGRGSTRSSPSRDTGGVPEPTTGTAYANYDSLYDAYLEHARKIGFCLVKRNIRKQKYVVIACDRSRLGISENKSKRIGCKAHLNAIKQEDGSWIVSSVYNEHNHELDPSTSVLMAGHRHMNVHMRRQLEANDIAGIRPSRNIRMCEIQAGGPRNIGCTSKDCRNFIDRRRRLRLGDGDAEAIRKLFWRLQQIDKTFYSLIDLDDKGRLRNVLWIHPRSRAVYEEFHDVVSFDTTYLVDRYEMPFGAFVGVNHHGHSTLLGCVLVTKEDNASMRWAFEKWLEAMNGLQPTAIITDQCESIKAAIREVMPETIHRYCLWHILSKVPGVHDYCRASRKFKKIIHESLTITSFENRWQSFLKEFHLQNKKWLRDLYDERQKWVPVYLNHIFWAGMLSTQRSEGMHAYFDEFFHSRISLKQFMEQYEVGISQKFEKEFKADADTKMNVVRLRSAYRWESQFRDAYTNSIFKKVQTEIDKLLNCSIRQVNYDDEVIEIGVEKFSVVERIVNNQKEYVKEFTYKVEYRPEGQYLSCNCRKFEFMGVICFHIMQVMKEKRIESINERYILRRWRKDVYRRFSNIWFTGGYPHMTAEYKKYMEVEKDFQDCMSQALGSEERVTLLKEVLAAWKIEVRKVAIPIDVTETVDEIATDANAPGGTP